MELMGFLILFPMLAAFLLIAIRHDSARNVIVVASSAIIMVASVVFVAMNLGASGAYYNFQSEIVDYVCLGFTIAIGAIIIWYSIKHRKWLALGLGLLQLVGAVFFDLVVAHEAVCTRGLYYDDLSLIMTLIIGVIGTGICIYSIGYMRDHHEHHPDEQDRRPRFFALMFLFLSAMYGIIFFNNLTWLFCAWEVTTVCSFLLIGYTRTQESIVNAFRQIVMNLVGGIAFLGALYYLVLNYGGIDFMEFIVFGTVDPNLVVLPLTLLGIAGMTKAAQMPFHTWLLGAMVAPTPTSALLHSSTMVKAGVFMLIKCAPIYAVSFGPSLMIILVGGITFLMASFLAISQTNAKRVLAYSTISNLGLITACAGVGTAEAIWAAIFLVVFHAIAKSLLFLCVGTAEHHISSRDIEDMDDLFVRMPKLARLMMVGIMIMFIAPFGMLIAKWATIVTFIDTNQVVLLIILAFGSAATFMFWGKWLGKLAGIAGYSENDEVTVHASEWFATYLMLVLAVAACILIPVISNAFVEPYIASVLGMSIQPVHDDNLILAALMVIFMAVVMFGTLNRGNGSMKQADVYLAGITVNSQKRVFTNALSQPMQATARNWYLEKYFGERRLDPVGTISCLILLCLGLAWAALSALGVLPFM